MSKRSSSDEASPGGTEVEDTQQTLDAQKDADQEPNVEPADPHAEGDVSEPMGPTTLHENAKAE